MVNIKKWLVQPCLVLFLCASANAATFTVNSTADTPDADLTDNVCADVDNLCTLRAAVEQANATAGADAIIFEQNAPLFANGGTINLTNGALVISDSASIQQTSATAPVIIDASGSGSRIFTVNAGVTVTLTRLRLDSGNGGSTGGAILNSGTLTVDQSNITGNTASQGGGIYNNGGTLNLNRSTLSGNSAGSGGGAIYNFNSAIGATATVNLTNSTVSNNVAGGGFGGGYFGFSDLGTTQLSANNATIVGNIALNGGGIAVTSTAGQTSRANIDNTIVGDNVAGDNGQDVFDNSSLVVPVGLPVGTIVSAGTITSTGYNIVENTMGATIAPQPCNTNPAQTCDQFGVDPRLLPLAENNFVFAPTHAPNTAARGFSPAIDKGDSQLSEDQRGWLRPVDNPAATMQTGGNNSDIGAFEVQNLAPTAATVTIGGRVLSANGRGIARARVSITDSNGETRRATTNSFGYYRFRDVIVGETYVFEASAKRHRFAAQVLTVGEETNGLNFIDGK